MILVAQWEVHLMSIKDVVFWSPLLASSPPRRALFPNYYPYSSQKACSCPISFSLMNDIQSRIALIKLAVVAVDVARGRRTVETGESGRLFMRSTR